MRTQKKRKNWNGKARLGFLLALVLLAGLPVPVNTASAEDPFYIESIIVYGVREPVVGEDPVKTASEIYVKDDARYTLVYAKWISANTKEEYSGLFREDEDARLDVLLEVKGVMDQFKIGCTGYYYTDDGTMHFFSPERTWRPRPNDGIGAPGTYYRFDIKSENLTPRTITIPEVRVTGIMEPVIGEKPQYTVSESGEGYHIELKAGTNIRNSVRWEDLTEGRKDMIPGESVFEEGHCYRCHVYLETDSAGYEFANNGSKSTVSGYMNGEEATVFWTGSKFPQAIGLFQDYTSASPKDINAVSVNGVTLPVAGEKPSYHASVSGSANYMVEDYDWKDTWVDGVHWKDMTAGKDLTPADTFQEGHTYQVMVSLIVKYGYDFPEEGISGTVNGQEADDVSLFQEDNIVVSTLFKCEGREIKEVSVSGIAEPEAGAKPSYSAKVESGARYRVSSNSTGKTKNGVLWYDATDRRYLSPDDTFVEGHNYRVYIDLEAKEGYVFDTWVDGRFLVEGILNGKTAEVEDTANEELLTLTCLYTCTCPQVDYVFIGFVPPEAGRHPTWGASVLESGAHYEVQDDYTVGNWHNGVLWVDVTENRYMTEDDIFTAEHTYRMTVSLVPKDGYEFLNYQDEGFSALFGNARPDVIIDWGDCATNIGLVRTFTLPARMPGDANADGKVDMRDALRVLQYVEGKTGVINLNNADVNGDGMATIKDALLIGQFAAGWNVVLK